jgi:hypothetical protein
VTTHLTFCSPPDWPALPTTTDSWTKRRSSLARFGKWLAENGADTNAIAATLNAVGQRTRQRRVWTPSAVRRLIGSGGAHVPSITPFA